MRAVDLHRRGARQRAGQSARGEDAGAGQVARCAEARVVEARGIEGGLDEAAGERAAVVVPHARVRCVEEGNARRGGAAPGH